MPDTADRYRPAGLAGSRRRLRALTLLPLVFLLAACGEDDGDGNAPASGADMPVPGVGLPAAAATASTVLPATRPRSEAEPIAPAPSPGHGTPAPATVPAPVAPPPTPAAPVIAEPAPVPETDGALAARLADADVEAGRLGAARCSPCHSFSSGEPSANGPNLFDIVGAPVGAVAGFTYSPAFAAFAATGATWTYDRLDTFLANPSVAVPGTRMGFAGIADEQQRADLIAWLRTLSPDPIPLPRVAGPEAFLADIAALGLRPATFTVEQVQIGRDTYARSCSTCHGERLGGVWYGSEWGQAPPLAGERFVQVWFRRSIADFVGAMEAADIISYASLHDGLSPAGYTAVAAYLLDQYGFVAGDVPLPVDLEELRGVGFWQ